MVKENRIIKGIKYYSVPGYEHYVISKCGKVWSDSRDSGMNRDGQFLTVYNDKKETMDGYLRVAFTVNKKTTHKRIHTILAKLFIDNPNNYNTVNHINGIKHDNRIENLEWCSTSENVQHAYDTGLITPQCGENNGGAKLTYKEVLEIRKKYVFRVITYQMLADEYNVSPGAIKRIIKRTHWKGGEMVKCQK